MAEESLYAVLGVPREASMAEIREAYRASSSSWEAAEKGNADNFKKLACAYALLSDPLLRAGYDENPDSIDLAKYELTFDLALKGYDDEMLSEYLRRLSIPEDSISSMVSALDRVRDALIDQPVEPVVEEFSGYRKVAAGQGWQWVVEGFLIFRKTPLVWVVLCMILTGIGLTLSLVPVAGEIALYLISPVFAAGLMQGCRDIENGGELELSHLFFGFRNQTGPLLKVGAVYLLGQMLILGLMISFGGDTMNKLFFGTSDFDPSSLPPQEMTRVMISLFIGMAISVPLMMMIWFAPLLVIFKGMQAKQAMQASFFACLANMTPFLIFGSVFLAMGFISGITFGLGLLLMIPLIFTSTYASYKDIFEAKPHIDIRAV
jgi:uncharacterized membrane protein